jgi:phenylacetate-CoA ligase
VADVVKRYPQIAKARLIVTGEMANDVMTLHCEVDDPSTLAADAVVESIRDITKLRGEVKLVGRGSLPNDGKVIEDARKYE